MSSGSGVALNDDVDAAVPADVVTSQGYAPGAAVRAVGFGRGDHADTLAALCAGLSGERRTGGQLPRIAPTDRLTGDDRVGISHACCTTLPGHGKTPGNPGVSVWAILGSKQF